MRRLHELNPKVKVLVYKDFSSTRNYPGAVDDGLDAQVPADRHRVRHSPSKTHPEWFAARHARASGSSGRATRSTGR